MKSKKKIKKFLLPDKTVWLNRGWQQAYIGFCPSERAWFSMLKRLGIRFEKYQSHADGNYASMHTFTNTKRGTCLVVTICDAADKKWRSDPAGVASAIGHEAIHVWQEVLAKMSERDRVSHEVEAYSVEAIMHMLLDAYLDTRIRIKKPKLKKRRK